MKWKPSRTSPVQVQLTGFLIQIKYNSSHTIVLNRPLLTEFLKCWSVYILKILKISEISIKNLNINIRIFWSMNIHLRSVHVSQGELSVFPSSSLISHSDFCSLIFASSNKQFIIADISSSVGTGLLIMTRKYLHSQPRKNGCIICHLYETPKLVTSVKLQPSVRDRPWTSQQCFTILLNFAHNVSQAKQVNPWINSNLSIAITSSTGSTISVTLTSIVLY